MVYPAGLWATYGVPEARTLGVQPGVGRDFCGLYTVHTRQRERFRVGQVVPLGIPARGRYTIQARLARPSCSMAISAGEPERSPTGLQCLLACYRLYTRQRVRQTLTHRRVRV
jgi:hypothetical protein